MWPSVTKPLVVPSLAQSCVRQPSNWCKLHGAAEMCNTTTSMDIAYLGQTDIGLLRDKYSVDFFIMNEECMTHVHRIIISKLTRQ